MKRTTISILAACVCACAALAQEAAQPASAAAQPVETAEPARNIRFQFDGIPYADVIQRFAQMAGKPLLADTNIAGTVTFNDPTAYTYTEALDTLNLILSMKGLMLIESGNYLRLVPFRELPAMPLRILRGNDPTGDTRPGEVVTVVLDVQHLDPNEVADSIRTMLSKAGSVAPLSKGHGLIVTDRLANIQRVRTLLATIDTEATVDRQMKTYTLLNASGAIVSDLLNRTFGVATAPKRTTYNPNTKAMVVLPPDPNDYITAVYDDASRTLVLFGPRDRVALAEEMINKFEQKDGAGGDVRIYYPQSIKADELAKIIREAVPGVAGPDETGAAAATKARVITDSTQNRLIVAAPTPGQLQQIEQLIDRVDKSPAAGNRHATNVAQRARAVRVTKVFRPQIADSANLASILTQTLTRRSPSGQATTTANVSHDPSSQSIIVRGTPDDLKIATDLLAQLEEGNSPQRRLQIFPLKHTRAEVALGPIQNLVADQMNDPRFQTVPKPSLMADPANNRLLVTGTEDQITAVQEVVAVIDVAQATAKREVRIIALHSKPAAEVIPVVTSLLEQTSEATPDPSLAPKLMADPAGKQIIVLALPDEFDRIGQLIAQFDATPATTAPRRFKAVEMLNRRAAELAPLVAQLYTEQLRGQPEPAGGPATVLAEPKDNRIMVSGPDKEIARVEAIIRQLDPAGRTGTGEETRVIKLKSALAADLAGLVEKSLNVQSDQVTVLADVRSNSLVVSGDSAAVEAASKVIRQLDSDAQVQPREMRIIELKQGDAATLSTLVNNLAMDLIKDQRGREYVPQTTVVPDPAGNRLILSGPKDELETVARVVKELDQPTQSSGGTRIFKLVNVSAAEIIGVVSNSMLRLDDRNQPVARVTVSLDPRSNSIIMSGPRPDLVEAGNLIQHLDQRNEESTAAIHPAAVKARKLKIIDVQSDDANALAAFAMTIFSAQTKDHRMTNLVTITPDLNRRRLIVLAPVAVLPEVEGVITTLDGKPQQGVRGLHTLKLKNSTASELLPTVERIYAEQTQGQPGKPAMIYPDPSGRRFTILGTPQQATAIALIVETVSVEADVPRRDTRIFEVGAADDVERLLPLVQQLYTGQRKDNAGTDPADAEIVADTATGRLIVTGKPEHLDQISEIIEKLDKPSAAPKIQVRLRPLDRVGAKQMAQLLQNIYPQMANGQVRVVDKVGDQGAPRSTKPGGSNDAGSPGAPGAPDNPPAGTQSTPSTNNATANVTISVDEQANALILSGPAQELDNLDRIITELSLNFWGKETEFRLFRLKDADPVAVAGTLNNLLRQEAAQKASGQGPQSGSAQPEITVVAEPHTRSVIVRARPLDYPRLESLISQLDVAPVIQEGVLEVFTLEFADAQRIAALLNNLAKQGLYGPGRMPQTRSTELTPAAPFISVDPKNNSLIVSGSPGTLALVRSIIEKLDTEGFSPTTDVRLYALKNAKASALATTLEQFFRATRGGGAGAPGKPSQRSAPVSILPDDRINSILVTGGKEAFDMVERLLPQLDGESAFDQLNFRVFPLKNATATKLQATLEPLFKNRPPKVKGQPLDPITIIADPWVNALLVGAAADDMSTIESLIMRMDSDAAETGLSIHVFQLAKADARRVATTVQSLFRQGPPGTEASVTVNADERINAIVVSCGETDAKRIGVLVKKLDTEQVARVSEIKVFPLKHARAVSLATILNTALNTKPTALSEQSPNAQSVLQFITRTEEGQELVTAALKEGILITPDARMNSIIVSGPVDYMGLMEQIIERLDASSPQQAQIKVFALQNADADQMARLLMQLFRMTQTAATTGNQRSIEYTLVRTGLDEEGVPMDQDTASATVGTAEQTALTITVDPRTNSLLVGGTEHYVSLVSEIIESLDSSPANERSSEVVRLKNSQARDVARAIRDFLDQDRRRTAQVLGADAVDAAQRILDREVAVVAEPLSNTLLVSANPRYFNQIRALIEELDKPQPQVLIQVLLAEVTLDKGLDLGMSWTYNGVPNAAGIEIDEAEWIANGFASAVTGGSYSFLVQALEEEGRLEVLSRPQIVTADNKPATINIGQRVPLITDSRVTERGDTINSFRYEDVGVNLSVTPKISLDGTVKMDIGTTNSAISSATVEINESATVPIINHRRANTTVSVPSGHTVLIGGLIATTDDKRITRIPWFGDIPILGVFFSKSRNTRERKELLILLTPQILSNPNEGEPDREAEAVTREQLDRSRIRDEIQRDDLQKQLLDPLFPGTEPQDTESSDKNSKKL